MSQQQLYKNVFGPATDNDQEVKLAEIVLKYPYYSTAHYFLLQHTDNDSPEYDRVAGRTALHFNNPYYLNHLLHSDHPQLLSENEEQIDSSTVEVESPIPVEDKVAVDEEIAEPIKEDRKKPGEDLMFEPLHTTDYFASQGIKLSEEIKADDKLGKQLRSFTDWLKTMKKVHEQKLPAGNPTLDITVQNIADKSNQEEDIITESMADVYKDQGKKGKAREIYQKLSLLDPAKSAYFAAKIDSLKDI